MSRAIKEAPVRVGIDGDGCDVEIDLIRDAAHILAVGATGSGKSSWAYGLLGGLKHLNQTPVRIVGIDPSHVLLWPYRGDELVHLGSDGAAVMSVLDGVLNEFERRLQHLAGSGTDRLDVVSSEWPLLVVVIEEYSTLMNTLEIGDRSLKAAERLKPRVEAAIDTLVAGGRKALVRVVLLTQRAASTVMSTNTRSNFSTRLSFRVDDDESLKMVFPSIEKETIRRVQSWPEGRGLIKSPGTDFREFRSDHVTYEAYRRLFEGGTP